MADSFRFPPAFAQRMQQHLQNDWPKFISAHHQPSPTSIRINAKKTTTKDLEKIGWTDFGYYLKHRPSFTFDPLFHAGTYYVQEASSMFLEQALKQTVDLSQPLMVLDLCAAPGGKSTHLLSLLNDQSLLVTNETIRARATVLSENIQKWGYGNAVVTNNDPENFHRLEGFFDVVIVDAPCSGEGLFRKDPEAMQQWTEENTSMCALRQQRIVKQIWPSLKENGVLIYCTCTYNEKENEDNLIELAKVNKSESCRLKLASDWGIEEILRNDFFGYRFYPHRVKGEGFFISVLQKKEKQDEIRVHSKNLFASPNKKIIERLSSWHTNSIETEYAVHDELIIALPENYIYEISLLTKILKVIQKGTAIATLKHDKLVPDHALALSTNLKTENFPCVELDHDQAIAYLRKDVLNPSNEASGFTLMKHLNTPLGWGNMLGNRMNNLYPSAWRIRNEVDSTLPG